MRLQEAVQEALAMEDELTRIRLLEQVAEKEVRPMACCILKFDVLIDCRLRTLSQGDVVRRNGWNDRKHCVSLLDWCVCVLMCVCVSA
jgi:hypothetical protein